MFEAEMFEAEMFEAEKIEGRNNFLWRSFPTYQSNIPSLIVASSSIPRLLNMSGSKDKGVTEDSFIPVDLKIWKEALVGEMRRLMREGLEPLHEYLDQVENARSGQPQPVRNVHGRQRVPVRREVDDYYGDEYSKEEESVSSHRRNGRLKCLKPKCLKAEMFEAEMFEAEMFEAEMFEAEKIEGRNV
ncbi:hypothetical protein Dsin_024548 [Dipteronia sinensis]|uniref:Uncharacterized protein n=1 Tax=Dipteronia sinensis TaxID=43782 RepID=A0AAD9ZVK2_9ROSI|nr:hypothetical protein Dsin_024548 [Dipteronia sinensis]